MALATTKRLQIIARVWRVGKQSAWGSLACLTHPQYTNTAAQEANTEGLDDLPMDTAS